MVKRYLVTALLLVALAYTFAQEKGIPVELTLTRSFPNTVAPAQARVELLRSLREAAIEKALPQDISLTSLTTDMYVERNASFDESTARSIFMVSSSAGRIIREEVAQDQITHPQGSDLYQYMMQYKAEVVPQEKVYNPELELKVELSNTALKDGEEFDLSISANRDGYLYIFDFLPDNTVALVLPTRSHPFNELKRDRAWHEKIGTRMMPGEKHSIETLYFVFSTSVMAGIDDFRRNENAEDLVFSAGEESFTLFQRWLAKGNPRDRVEKMAQIHIFR
jgi:hypothetical protein